jgi:hypothetical protein
MKYENHRRGSRRERRPERCQLTVLLFHCVFVLLSCCLSLMLMLSLLLMIAACCGRESASKKMTLCVVLFALVCVVASKLNPTCGIGCDYLGSDSFAFNCESSVFHKGEVYNYASFMLACADKR